MRILVIFFCCLYPWLGGACNEEDGIFAYVQNRNGKGPASNVAAYKLSVTSSVFRKLLEARGDFRMPPPELVMNDGQLYVAWMNSKKEQVGLEEKAYDLCATFGADSLNALAALLAHELTHYYEKHDWTRHFSRANANTEAGAQLAKLEEGLKLEVQSDYLGGFLALSAVDRRLGLRARIDGDPTLSAAFYAVVVALTLLLGAGEGAAFIYFQF